MVDRNAHDASLPDDPQPEVRYGQLLYIAHVTLSKNRRLGIREDTEALLGMVEWCKDAIGDASREPIWYKESTEKRELQAVNMATIQNGVGRVKVGKQWGILDLSYGCARMAFIDDGRDSDTDEE